MGNPVPFPSLQSVAAADFDGNGAAEIVVFEDEDALGRRTARVVAPHFEGEPTIVPIAVTMTAAAIDRLAGDATDDITFADVGGVLLLDGTPDLRGELGAYPSMVPAPRAPSSARSPSMSPFAARRRARRARAAPSGAFHLPPSRRGPARTGRARDAARRHGSARRRRGPGALRRQPALPRAGARLSRDRSSPRVSDLPHLGQGLFVERLRRRRRRPLAPRRDYSDGPPRGRFGPRRPPGHPRRGRERRSLRRVGPGRRHVPLGKSGRHAG